MEELNPFLIDEETKPSFETDVAKWYLISKKKHYAGWRWDSKKDETHKLYLITDIETSEPVAEDHQLESMLVKLDMFDIMKEKE